MIWMANTYFLIMYKCIFFFIVEMKPQASDQKVTLATTAT